MTQQTSKKADEYFDHLFEEKENIQDFSYCESKGNHIWEFNYTPDDMLTILKSLDPKTKHQIIHTLTIIDYKNGDINHFLNYVFKGYAKMQMED